MMIRLNDEERTQWVENDEGLYSWWKSTGKGITTFVRENREELDKHIRTVLERSPT